MVNDGLDREVKSMAHSVSQPGSTTVPQRMTYRDIADDLAERMTAGEYPSGAQLPSTAQLAALYSVSVATVVRAVGLLHDRGLVRGEAGVGVFVV
jgi:GntR family transcriptional regulator